jgi:hypothetical protein
VPADAEEAVDAAFEQLLKAWTTVRSTENPAGYAWMVLRHCTLVAAMSSSAMWRFRQRGGRAPVALSTPGCDGVQASRPRAGGGAQARVTV